MRRILLRSLICCWLEMWEYSWMRGHRLSFLDKTLIIEDSFPCARPPLFLQNPFREVVCACFLLAAFCRYLATYVPAQPAQIPSFLKFCHAIPEASAKRAQILQRVQRKISMVPNSVCNGGVSICVIWWGSLLLLLRDFCCRAFLPLPLWNLPNTDDKSGRKAKKRKLARGEHFFSFRWKRRFLIHSLFDRSRK